MLKLQTNVLLLW